MEVLKQSKIELWCKLLMRFENELKMYLRVGFQWRRKLKESRGSTNGNYFTLGEILFSDNHNNSIHFFWFPLRFEIYYKEEGGGKGMGTYPSFYFIFFEKIRVSLPKPIWVFRILEYSTISLLNFQDTLVNVGLPGMWLKYESNQNSFSCSGSQIKLVNVSLI